MLDLEHGPYSPETVEDAFKTGRASVWGASSGCRRLAKGYVSCCLDAGATGIMVPMLESVEQAKHLVAGKYAPWATAASAASVATPTLSA
jgi:2-keto-3-deoxy-L-rhamnonate aldolase RhmA